MATCAACGGANRPAARFCDACGTPLTPSPAPEGASRKVVSIVFADLIGSTAMHERLDAESARATMDRYYRALRAEVARHGGTVVKLLGDGLMAAFGVPRVGEDDALRAVRAADAMQAGFRRLALSGVGLRVAVNTGEVVVRDDHADVVGDPVNVAARLQEAAGDGEVLVGAATARLVEDIVTLAPRGTLVLKGRAGSVEAYRLVSLDRPAGAAATPFVGRDDAVARLLALWDDAVTSPGARLAVVLGAPGLGKSRLLAEVERRLDGATVIRARCDAAGGATFAPIAEALRRWLGIRDDTPRETRRAAVVAAGAEHGDAGRITEGVEALLSGAPAPADETFFVVRRLLAAAAAARPVLLTVDDVQWAEPLLLDLAEHLVQWSPDTPLLVLLAARPELRDARPSLVTPGGRAQCVLSLAGLDAAAATRLAAAIIGADALPAAIAGRVLAASEGNPLFVGELVRMLVQDGAIRREDGRWVAAAHDRLEMPPTIHAVLAARIDRLAAPERIVLERAAVVGHRFSRAAVAHLLDAEEAARLDGHLEALQHAELIEADATSFRGEPGLRFHHVLVRDAAYRRLLKETRAELHARLADWLSARAGDARDADETVGWHLEQAHRLLGELGPLDARGRALGERAGRVLGAAGRRALARDDVHLAAGLLGRALDRLEATDPGRADLALDFAEALLSAGDVAAAARAVAELERAAGDSARLRAWHACLAGQLAVLTDPQALRATVTRLEEAGATLAAAGDAAGEAKAYSVHALALGRLGAIGAAEASLDRALAAARRARDRRRANVVLAGVPPAALWGPSPVTRASGRCLDVVRVLRITQGAPAVEAVALRCQAVLETLRGRSEAARRMIASSRRLLEELGLAQRLLETDVAAGLIELIEGDAAAAEHALRPAYEALRRHGLQVDAAQAAALLGRALLAQSRVDEADTLSRDSEALAGDDLKAAIAWRGVRAEALARRGEGEAGVALARAAVAIAEATDALLDHADARAALAVALHAAGRHAEADDEAARAMALWEAKGATLPIARAALGGRASPPPPAPGARGRRRRARRNAPFADVRGAARPPDQRASARDAGAVPMPDLPDAMTPRQRALTAGFWTALATRDWDALAALLAPDLEVCDHRRLGWEALRGPAAYVDALRGLVELAPDVHLRLDRVLDVADRAVLYAPAWEGTREGGPFEEPSLMVAELDDAGLIRRFDQYDHAQATDARARFAEAAAAPSADPLARFLRPNRATAAMDRVQAAFDARDWDAMRAACAPHAVTDDRRRHVLVGGDVEFWIADWRRIAADEDACFTRRLVVRVGERIAIERMHWRIQSADEGRADIEYLLLTEVDAEGRIVAAIAFDLDDRAAARDEAELRWFAQDPAAAPAGLAARALAEAVGARDEAALRRLLPADFVMHDHRRAGVGRSEGIEAYLGSLTAMWALSDDAQVVRESTVVLEPHALLGTSRVVGALHEGGGPFESTMLTLVVAPGGRIARVELFEPDQLDTALARLAAARPDRSGE